MKKKRKYADSLKIVAENSKVKVVMDPDDAELADAIICRSLTDPLVLPNNLVGKCSKCGGDIQFRPHCPKKPPKICDTCAFPIMQKEMKKGELVTMITPKTVDDVVNYIVQDMLKKWKN